MPTASISRNSSCARRALTQLRLSGRLGTSATGVRFEGSTRLEASDPRAFLAWLTERNEEQGGPAGPLRLAGDVTLGD